MGGRRISGHGAAVVGSSGHLAGDSPQEARQFPGHGGGHLAVCLASVREPAMAGAQALLGGPGEGLDPGWGACCLALQMGRLAGWEAIAANMRPPRFLFDGRNLLDPPSMVGMGFEYVGVGRVNSDGRTSVRL